MARVRSWILWSMARSAARQKKAPILGRILVRPSFFQDFACRPFQLTNNAALRCRIYIGVCVQKRTCNVSLRSLPGPMLHLGRAAWQRWFQPTVRIKKACGSVWNGPSVASSSLAADSSIASRGVLHSSWQWMPSLNCCSHYFSCYD